MERKKYDTDLSEAEWAILEPLLPPPKPKGRHREVAMREVVNAILYVLRGGIPWRILPHDFPPWKTVYHYFRLWRLDATWKAVHDTLREKERLRLGRQPSPSAAILDSQTVKTSEKGAAGLRRGQEDNRPQAPLVGRHPRISPCGEST